MSGLTISVDDRQIRAALRRLSEKLDDLTPAMDRIGAYLANEARKTFIDARSPWGAPWAPLKEATVARRRKRSNVPLRDTGRLMNSIGHVASRHRVSVGTNVKYAPTHQFGAKKWEYGTRRVTQNVRAHQRRVRGKTQNVRAHTRQRTLPIPWGDVPARPFLPIRDGRADLPERQAAYVLDVLSDYLGGDG